MAIEKLGTTWEMVGLRVTVKNDGHVEFDLVHRKAGATQTVWPVGSIQSGHWALEEALLMNVLDALVIAAGGLVADMVR